jgi:hypothetical protein
VSPGAPLWLSGIFDFSGFSVVKKGGWPALHRNATLAGHICASKGIFVQSDERIENPAFKGRGFAFSVLG